MSMSNIVAFVIGLFIGGNVALIIICLIIAGRDNDF